MNTYTIQLPLNNTCTVTSTIPVDINQFKVEKEERNWKSYCDVVVPAEIRNQHNVSKTKSGGWIESISIT